MDYKYITQKELNNRIEYQAIEKQETDIYPESYYWLSSLMFNLVKVRNSEATLDIVLQQEADKLTQSKENRDRIQFELAHIPIEGCLEWKGKEQFTLAFHSNDENINYCDFNTNTFPKNAFPQNHSLENLTEDNFYWFFLTLPALEICYPDYQHINPKDIITWSEYDSIVHWIMQFASNNKQTITPQITQHGDSIEDIFWKLHLPKTQLTKESQPTIVKKTTAKNRILRFIQEKGMVTAAEIIAQSFCKRANVFKSLKSLEKENKIERIAHGKYIPVTSPLHY